MEKEGGRVKGQSKKKGRFVSLLIGSRASEIPTSTLSVPRGWGSPTSLTGGGENSPLGFSRPWKVRVRGGNFVALIVQL